MNEAAFRDEYIFISYDDVLRSHIPSVITKLLEQRPLYDNFINYERIEKATESDIMWLSQIRTSYNMLEYLKKNEFDYDLTLMNIIRQIDNVYSASPELVMVNTCRILLQESFTKKIYIYSQNKNPIIDKDIVDLFGDNEKITILTGDFQPAISTIPDSITMYIVNSILMADIIISHAKNQYADILVAEYGYNYKMSTGEIKAPVLLCDGIAERATNNHFRLNMFMPIVKDIIDPVAK